MRRCKSCDELKPLDKFRKVSPNSPYYRKECRDCENEERHEKYVELKVEAVDYLGGECVRCGYDKYYGALEFHHVDPNEKDKVWNVLRKEPWEKIVEELNKCVCLCANCHREVHHELRMGLLNENFVPGKRNGSNE